MIYNPTLSEKQLEVKFSKLRKLKYNPYRWWRMYDVISKPSSPRTPLLLKIKNGDYDCSHYDYQAMWCEHEMNKIYKQLGYQDMGRYVEETSLLRSRRKRLLEDHFKDEDSKLESLTNDLSKHFNISKDFVKEVMEEFGGTIEDLYIHLAKDYKIKLQPLPDFLLKRP